ncbi:uncharacterized protein DNG_05361 [Cephalotrichum gorgonifer]|uniref:Nuclear fusion protein KAR5 n=1 Tax=Cephalotrichum gorgonifer TaxID=2041049 RepID=A0AAE8MZS5_9PEZI|nr:uncharacterized protein DNG_05361 [Cephalotrichum gorgonifer]
MKLALGFFWVGLAQSWIWDGDETFSASGQGNIATNTIHPHSNTPRLPNIYAVAIKELQELESEPLCHRTAARLLVNDCQMLEGKDEATVLTDSGRRVRDFVDFYAASLAICDLERGSFEIPTECTKFREGALAQIPMPRKPELHVSSKDIDLCLASLAKSDSAWSTWSIHLYQRITKVIETLITRVDEEMEKRAEGFDRRVGEAEDSIESLKPKIGHLGEELDRLKETLSGRFDRTVENSAGAIRRSLEDATTLQRILSVLLSSVLESNAEMASSHDKAVGTIKTKTSEGVDIVLSTLAAVAASSSAVEKKIRQSHRAIMELENRQEALHKGLVAAIHRSQILEGRIRAHDEKLGEVGQKTAMILETLDEASVIASDIRGTVGSMESIYTWPPYIVGMVYPLVLGYFTPLLFWIWNIGLTVIGRPLKSVFLKRLYFVSSLQG